MRIFVAGASGVIGRLLLPQLVQAGHEVIGMTRKEEQRLAIEQTGATAVLADVFDREQLMDILTEMKPDVVIHQLYIMGVRTRFYSRIGRDCFGRKCARSPKHNH